MQRANWNTSILGVSNDYLEARDWPLASGRVFDTAELAGSAKVCWIGATVARELFGEQDPVEQVMRVRNIPITVIGVLAPKGQNSMGQDQDDAIMMPLSTLRTRIWGGDATSRLKRVGSISVKVREGQDMKAVEESIKDLLRQRFKVPPGGDDPFQVRNLTEMLQAQEESSRVMTLLLAAVAGLIAHVPGNLGVLEAVFVGLLGHRVPPHLLLAALLGYLLPPVSLLLGAISAAACFEGDVAAVLGQGFRFDLKVSAIAGFLLLVALPWVPVLF